MASGRLRHISHHRQQALADGWELCSLPAGSCRTPADLASTAAAPWVPAEPGTVAQVLKRSRQWSLDEAPRQFDADDWWYRLRLDLGPTDAQGEVAPDLLFGGLATLCEVWLNGRSVLLSSNMHLAHELRNLPWRSGVNELVVCCRSLDAWLAARRARPRWRTPMVAHQQLRWARTSLLGRTPGWSPPVAVVGLWGGVRLQHRSAVDVAKLSLLARVEGTDGLLSVQGELAALAPGGRIGEVWLELEREGRVHRVRLARGEAPEAPRAWAACIKLPDVDLWWPHTHGEPALYAARLLITVAGSAQAVRVDLGAVGFRTITLERDEGAFALRVNGVRIFCRGACWTPLDVVSLRATVGQIGTAIEQVRDAGMNMLRIAGSMVYESDEFLDACDAQGIMVWQDFMFSNMDYPHEDAAFMQGVRDEAAQQLARWQARPSITVLCGNSECEQQAAMWGAPRASWSSPLFEQELAELSRTLCPGVPYWPSSAHGGAFPHQNNAGTTSYYGVGAYLRPLEDARRSGLRFATECLALANVPGAATLARVPGGAGLRAHNAAWKARSPRDLGAGWDFDDVRDHYLEQLYRADARALRSTDHERYLALSRCVGAELMAAALAEWRRGSSSCSGALVWFLRDLWPGAGWGVLDDQGAPKAAFHGLRRACAPQAVFLHDEGNNGLELQLVNDRARSLDAHIELATYRDDDLLLHHAERTLRVPARGNLAASALEWFDGFTDLNHSYRFGPAEHAMTVATLRSASGEQMGQAFHFTHGLPTRRERDIGLRAQARLQPDGSAKVTLHARRFAQSVHFDVPGFIAQDEYFHLAPGGERTVTLRPMGAGPLRGTVAALNSWAAAPIELAA